jgi:hypothetical protein
MTAPKQVYTPVFKRKLDKAKRIVKNKKILLRKDSKKIILEEENKRGLWRVSLVKNKVLSPKHFLIAVFFKERNEIASSYSIRSL